MHADVLVQLVLTTGSGVNGFTLDPSLGEFILTHPNIQVRSLAPASHNLLTQTAITPCTTCLDARIDAVMASPEMSSH